MSFPPKIDDRVIFNKNPLIEVVFQINFVSLNSESALYFDQEDIKQLHRNVQERLPQFKKNDGLAINVESKTNTVTKETRSVYEFASLDDSERVVIHPDTISVVTKQYCRKEDFFEFVDSIFHGLQDIKFIPPIVRVGLRYRDVIQKSILGLSDRSWQDLLKDEIVWPLLNQELNKQVIGFQNNFAVVLEGFEHKIKPQMNANFVLVNNAESSEKCVLIDSDIYIENREGVLDYATATNFRDFANLQSRYFFRWCIKNDLYKALEPVDA